MNARLSGALRLTRERVRIAIYLADGVVIFAASNLRAHRLIESVKHNPSLQGLTLNDLPPAHSDDELASALIERGLITPEALGGIRERQVVDVLRVGLLWTNGTWEFDPRIRIGAHLNVQVDTDRLLLECARHLPASFVAARINRTNGAISRSARDATKAALLPAEASVLSRVEAAATVKELTSIGGVSAAETYGAIYALALGGLIDRSGWLNAFVRGKTDSAKVKTPETASDKSTSTKEADDEASELENFFVRVGKAEDHYDVLDVGRAADTDEIKRAYHLLARRFHPDRFHQRDPQLRQRVESTFARVAQAYETLGNESPRASYDAKLKSKTPPVPAMKSEPSRLEQSVPVKSQTATAKNASGESSFQRGLAALGQNQRELGLRLLAEAAMLEPRTARYRAQYGYALIREPGTRRVAETELQAAISLEPNNASHRVMLAELYKQLGLKRRAEGELERALVVDPRNEAARNLLSSLKKS